MRARGNASVFYNVAKKAGVSYACYQAVELIGYHIVAKLRTWIGMNKRPANVFQTIHDSAKMHGLPVYDVYDLQSSDFIHKLKEIAPDILISVRVSWMIPRDVLNIVSTVVGFHGSLLPKYAGLASVFHAIADGEAEVGGSLFRVTQELDNGEVLAQFRIPVRHDKSVSWHHVEIYNRGAVMLRNFLNSFSHDGRGEGVRVSCSGLAPQSSYYSWPTSRKVKEFMRGGGNLFAFPIFGMC